MKVLLTGAAGGVASMMRPRLLERYGSLILSDREDMTGLAEGESFLRAQLGNADEVRAICEGVDGIVHLGGQPIEASWEVVNEANIQGAYHLFEAARHQGVERVIFASSNHAVGMYNRARKINAGDRVRPDSRYGVSKAFGEALGSLYADKHGLRVTSIRIGHVIDRPIDERRMSIWVHPDDLFQLIAIALEHPELHNEIFFGQSHNMRGYWDNDRAYRFGYRPAHRAEDHAAYAMGEQAKLPPDPIGDRLHGGPFTSAEFDGDLDRTLWG